MNKFEESNYDLLYNLINNLFDENLSEKTKEKFQEYLNSIKINNSSDNEETKIKKTQKRGDIMKILKAVYRLKLNKSIENKKVKKIQENSKSVKTKEQKNQLLAEIKDISSHIDLATSFHNFSKKTYYICNAKQLKKNYNKNIKQLSEDEIKTMSPLYYVNGICCFNPLIKEYMNSEGVKEAISKKIKAISKGNSSNSGGEILDMDSIIDNIETYNDKNSILSKFFDKYILGIANEYGKINKNSDSEINSTNFDRFCDECQSKIDTIVVIENGNITFNHTKKQESDGVKIFENYYNLQKKNRKTKNIQVGGVEPITSTLGLLSLSIGFFAALITCYDSNSTSKIIIKIIKYPVCVLISTCISTVLLLASLFFFVHSGPFGSAKVLVIAGAALTVGEGVKEVFKTNIKLGDYISKLREMVSSNNTRIEKKNLTENELMQKKFKNSFGSISNEKNRTKFEKFKTNIIQLNNNLKKGIIQQSDYNNKVKKLTTLTSENKEKKIKKEFNESYGNMKDTNLNRRSKEFIKYEKFRSNLDKNLKNKKITNDKYNSLISEKHKELKKLRKNINNPPLFSSFLRKII